jgi:simple sugar transport system permease protein
MLKEMLKRNEYLVALTIVGLSIIIGFINPVFFSIGNLFDLLRSSVVMGIFAMGVLIVIVSGGIDVSFTAIAVVSMYITVKLMVWLGWQGPLVAGFAISAVVGLGLGMINAVFIARFKLPTLIVTLGTLSMFRGFMLFVIGSYIIRDIPATMTDFSRNNLVTLTTESGALTSLHSSIILLAVVVVGVWLLLKYTMLGRGIFALGGAREAAERAGFNINRIQYFIYGFVGFLAGVGGFTHGAMIRQANPFDLVGSELDVIAAVVLGGAQLTGGRGTVIGTLLGVALVVIMNNSLILVGIPSIWQKVVIGLIIIIGTGIPAYRNRQAERRLTVNLAEQ